MSNFEKANDLARKWIDSMGGLSNINHIYGDDIGVLIYTLRDAGLLAPDLPEPYRPGVFKAISPYLGIRSVQATEGQITLHGYRTRHTSVGEARRLALALLAACEYTEKGQDSER